MATEANDDGNYEVEKILDTRIGGDGHREFLLKWEGYGPEHNCWVQGRDMSCREVLHQFNVMRVRDKLPPVSFLASGETDNRDHGKHQDSQMADSVFGDFSDDESEEDSVSLAMLTKSRHQKPSSSLEFSRQSFFEDGENSAAKTQTKPRGRQLRKSSQKKNTLKKKMVSRGEKYQSLRSGVNRKRRAGSKAAAAQASSFESRPDASRFAKEDHGMETGRDPLQLENDLRSAAAALNDRLPTELGLAPVSYLASKLADAFAGEDHVSPPKEEDVSSLPALPAAPAAPVLSPEHPPVNDYHDDFVDDVGSVMGGFSDVGSIAGSVMPYGNGSIMGSVAGDDIMELDDLDTPHLPLGSQSIQPLDSTMTSTQQVLNHPLQNLPVPESSPTAALASSSSFPELEPGSSAENSAASSEDESPPAPLPVIIPDEKNSVLMSLKASDSDVRIPILPPKPRRQRPPPQEKVTKKGTKPLFPDAKDIKTLPDGKVKVGRGVSRERLSADSVLPSRRALVGKKSKSVFGGSSSITTPVVPAEKRGRSQAVDAASGAGAGAVLQPSQTTILQAIEHSGVALLEEMARITSSTDRLFCIKQIISRLSVDGLLELLNCTSYRLIGFLEHWITKASKDKNSSLIESIGWLLEILPVSEPGSTVASMRKMFQGKFSNDQLLSNIAARIEKKWEMAAIQTALVKSYRERYLKLNEETKKAAAALKRKKSKSLQFNSKVESRSFDKNDSVMSLSLRKSKFLVHIQDEERQQAFHDRITGGQKSRKKLRNQHLKLRDASTQVWKVATCSVKTNTRPPPRTASIGVGTPSVINANSSPRESPSSRKVSTSTQHSSVPSYSKRKRDNLRDAAQQTNEAEFERPCKQSKTVSSSLATTFDQPEPSSAAESPVAANVGPSRLAASSTLRAATIPPEPVAKLAPELRSLLRLSQLSVSSSDSSSLRERMPLPNASGEEIRPLPNFRLRSNARLSTLCPLYIGVRGCTSGSNCPMRHSLEDSLHHSSLASVRPLSFPPER